MTETKTASKHREAKRKAKDSVFADLFSDPKYLLVLYKALHPEDTSVTEDMLEYVTIENVISNGEYNDLGFTVRNKRLILLEAQSTYTENIIVRILFYLAETWKRHIIMTEQDNYHSKKLKLPIPEFYVIFSGVKTQEERKKYPDTLSLKDSFFPGEDCAVDLTVKMLYGDPYPSETGHLEKGDIVWEFVSFCKIFDGAINKEHCDRTDLLKVIDDCKKQNILCEYLSKRRTEVIGIMSFLFTQEEVTEMRIKRERREQAEEFAKKLLKKGKLSTEEISDCLGLTIDKVEALEKEILEEA